MKLVPKLRFRDIAAAMLVIGIPTFATIYASDVTPWSWWPKLLLGVLWVGAAAVFSVDGVRRDRNLDANMEAAAGTIAQTRQRRRNAAVDAALRQILSPREQLGRKWEWTVYVFDSERNLLVPVWPTPDPASPELLTVKSFAPDCGATGQAWTHKDLIVRYGDDVHNGAHGLTAAQQAHFGDRNAVVATPIFDDDDDLIGVLAGVADEPLHDFDQGPKRAQLNETAGIVGTLIITLFDSLGEDD